MSSAAIISAIPILGKLIDKWIPDKDAATKIKAELLTLDIEKELTELGYRRDVVVAEAKSEHKLTSTWRPILMLTFTAIVANNYILAPYLELLFHVDVILDLPSEMWTLLTVGTGGYIASRGFEKVSHNLKK